MTVDDPAHIIQTADTLALNLWTQVAMLTATGDGNWTTKRPKELDFSQV